RPEPAVDGEETLHGHFLGQPHGPPASRPGAPMEDLVVAIENRACSCLAGQLPPGCHLQLELRRMPQIVDIEPRNHIGVRLMEQRVTRFPSPSILRKSPGNDLYARLPQDARFLLQPRPRSIGGAVIEKLDRRRRQRLEEDISYDLSQ